MIKNLTGLRGVFILFIFFHHCLNLYPGGGTLAVAFFFVLGGFSTTLGYRNRILENDFEYKSYIRRRLIKYYPLHWMCLLVALPLSLWMFNWKVIPLFFINAALLQTWIPIKAVYFSFNAVSWYLANTVFFAAVYPMILRRIAKSPFKVLIVSLMFYIGISVAIPPTAYHAILYINPIVRMLDFMLGVYLAIFYMKLREKTIKWAGNSFITQMIIIILIISLVAESGMLSEKARLFAVVYWPLIVVLILFAAMTDSNRGGYNILYCRCMQKIGEVSFTIFLTHQLILRYARIIFDRILRIDNEVIYVVSSLVVTLVVSILIDNYILKPVTECLLKKNQRSMIAPS